MNKLHLLKFKNLVFRRNVKLGTQFLSIMFVMTAFLGWTLETVFFAGALGCFTDRGFVVIPMVPVYGLAAVAIYLLIGTPFTRFWARLTHKFKHKVLAYFIVYILYFLLSTLIASVAELLGGLLLDKVLHVQMWHYHDYDFNFLGYICLQYSLSWGLIITVYMSVVRKMIENLCMAYGYRVVQNLAAVLCFYLVFDFIVCSVYCIKTGKMLKLFGKTFWK